MTKEDNAAMETRGCTEQEERLLLYAVSELEGAKRAEFEEHLAKCADCATALEDERTLLAALASSAAPEEPDASFLAGCRAGLADALDREEDRQWLRRWVNSLLGGDWPAWKPLATAAALLLMGFSAGFLSPRWARLQNRGDDLARVTPPNPSINDPEVQTADLAGLRVTPASDNSLPQVSMTLNSQKPITVQGTVNDPVVKGKLLYVLDNGQRFQPDVRLDSVELLEPRLKDADVLQALCHMATTDPNPAVRLRALEELRGAAPSAEVEQAFRDALEDKNPGVRIEAVNALGAMMNGGRGFDEPRTMDVLRDRMHSDPNNYVRVQSASLVRQLGAPQQ